ERRRHPHRGPPRPRLLRTGHRLGRPRPPRGGSRLRAVGRTHERPHRRDGGLPRPGRSRLPRCPPSGWPRRRDVGPPRHCLRLPLLRPPRHAERRHRAGRKHRRRPPPRGRAARRHRPDAAAARPGAGPPPRLGSRPPLPGPRRLPRRPRTRPRRQRSPVDRAGGTAGFGQRRPPDRDQPRPGTPLALLRDRRPLRLRPPPRRAPASRSM
ncbi:MAG: DNA-3-methyladenine glycosylase II, partial [uncultured Thermomicrobiales bacterium]